ncbi:undecaprenyl-diphosphate phosphatase [Paracoccus marinaquae]
MEANTLVAAALGLLEGLTEFIPVSSTGHVLLAGHFLGFQSPGRAFEVVIQLGAVLAILGVYAGRIWQILSSAPRDPDSRRFIAAVLLAFLPAVVVGVAAHDIIKTVLFETPMLIAAMLILGGIILLFVDRWARHPQYFRAEDFPLAMAFKIGLIQCLAMIPGVSRSGATIVGALLLGADKRSAAEFSFFLSMPTMLGAFAYDLYKNRDVLDAAALGDIAIGFACAFVTAVLVVRWLLGYVSQKGYALFAWWRIIVGALAMLALSA